METGMPRCFVKLSNLMNTLQDRIHHFPLLRLLQSQQSIWQFSATVLPPKCHGVMWSASICDNSKCCPQSAQKPI